MFNAFQAFEIRKYKPIVIQLSSFSTSLTKFCKKAHFKGAVFLQSPRSCKKLFKVSIKSLKNMKNLLKISKILVQQQKWNGLHYMHFFRDFSAWMISSFLLKIRWNVEQIKSRHCKKNVWKTLGEMYANKKTENRSIQFLVVCMGFIYTSVFVHPPVNNSRRMKVIQVSYAGRTKLTILIYGFLFTVWKRLLSKAKISICSAILW